VLHGEVVEKRISHCGDPRVTVCSLIGWYRISKTVTAGTQSSREIVRIRRRFFECGSVENRRFADLSSVKPVGDPAKFAERQSRGLDRRKRPQLARLVNDGPDVTKGLW
jgi:hypothetical protein